jgi:hypothetical protein
MVVTASIAHAQSFYGGTQPDLVYGLTADGREFAEKIIKNSRNLSRCYTYMI